MFMLVSKTWLETKARLTKTNLVGPFLNTDLMRYSELGWFERERVRLPNGKSVPEPQFNEVVVFWDFFVCGCA